MLDINKQKMQYSVRDSVSLYMKKKMTEALNTTWTVKETKYRSLLMKRQDFLSRQNFANISNKLSEVLVKEFGIDDSSTYVQIVTDKGYLPLKAGDVVWKRSGVLNDSDGNTDPLSADYIVKGVADEGLTVDLFLLQKVVK